MIVVEAVVEAVVVEAVVEVVVVEVVAVETIVVDCFAVVKGVHKLNLEDFENQPGHFLVCLLMSHLNTGKMSLKEIIQMLTLQDILK